MNTNLTKQGTVPQKGLDRLKYIKKRTELVIDNPSHPIAVALRDGDYLYHRIAIECDWDWLNFDYGLYPEPPKIQLRLPMYIKYKTKTVSVVTSLNARHQHITVDGGEWRVQAICNDLEYSNDGTNWQPFTGNEVM